MKRYLLILFVLIALPTMADDTFEIWLWGNSKASQDKRVLEIADHHACTGKIVKIRTKRMPLPDEALEGEKVIELSREGKIINTWYMQVNEIVLGIEGSNILTSLDNSKNALKISTDGNLSYVPAPQYKNEWMECPAADIKAISNSSYLRCFKYTDLRTGQERFLAYQVPCT